MPLSWLWPHLRVGAGAAHTQLKLEDFSSNLDVAERSFGAAVTVGGGLSFRTPTRLFEKHDGSLASLSFALLVEGGYRYAQAAEFELSDHRRGENGLDVPSVSLGDLARSGPYLRAAVVLRM
jgi:hypothetical protein